MSSCERCGKTTDKDGFCSCYARCRWCRHEHSPLKGSVNDACDCRKGQKGTRLDRREDGRPPTIA